MLIGFLGAGRNAQTIARRLLMAGHTVALSNSRGPETLAETVAGLGVGASAATRAAVATSDVVMLAVNWPDVERALDGLDLTGRILIDATNAHAASPPDLSAQGVAKSLAALNGRTSSEIVAERAPGARLVKAISNLPMAWMPDFGRGEPRTAMFLAGDDAAAKAVVAGVLEDIDFAPIDLGPLISGGGLFQLGGPLSGLQLHLVRKLVRDS